MSASPCAQQLRIEVAGNLTLDEELDSSSAQGRRDSIDRFAPGGPGYSRITRFSFLPANNGPAVVPARIGLAQVVAPPANIASTLFACV